MGFVVGFVVGFVEIWKTGFPTLKAKGYYYGMKERNKKRFLGRTRVGFSFKKGKVKGRQKSNIKRKTQAGIEKRKRILGG